MKLRNKKTGEMGFVYTGLNGEVKVCSEHDENHTCLGQYSSLSELNEEWEDYKKSKEYWRITDLGELKSVRLDQHHQNIEKCKQIGNYFETEEEAEKAVEKLKAWKLLRDECDIKFDGIRDEARIKAVKISYDRHPVTFARMLECRDALHLLFGGEE